MTCSKFEVLRGTKKLGDLYYSGSGRLSRFEKLRICFRHNLSSAEHITFRPTDAAIDDSRLPARPTFSTFAGDTSRKFWVYPLGEPLPD